MKSKHFSNASRYSSLYVISSIRQPAAQDLDKIHVLYARKFCTRLRLNLCWCTSEACKYKNAVKMAATMTTAILAAKGIHKTSRSSQALLHESFTTKWWLSFKIEAWKCIKNKLLKFFNSTKMDYVFAGLKLNIVFKKSARKMHLSWMMLRKQVALNNQMLRLGCCLPPPIEIPGYVPGCERTSFMRRISKVSQDDATNKPAIIPVSHLITPYLPANSLPAVSCCWLQRRHQ